MAKRKVRMVKAKRGKGLPKLSDVKIPKKGLLDPSLRRDIGNVPGLARVR